MITLKSKRDYQGKYGLNVVYPIFCALVCSLALWLFNKAYHSHCWGVSYKGFMGGPYGLYLSVEGNGVLSSLLYFPLSSKSSPFYFLLPSERSPLINHLVPLVIYGA
jgi:hypothetical protein